MHTLRPSTPRPNPVKYDVVFVAPTHQPVAIFTNLPRQEALKWVNYLNGGVGNTMDSQVDVKNWDNV